MGLHDGPVTDLGIAAGGSAWNDKWDDVSLEAIARRQQHTTELLARLDAFSRTDLSPSDQLNYDLFRRGCQLDVEEAYFRWFLVPLTQREGIQTSDELADSLRFETIKDYEDWIGRCAHFDKYVDQTIALMREGIKARIVQPKVTMERVPGQIKKQIVSRAEESPFFKPFRKFPDSISQADREKLRNGAREAIEKIVLPAYRQFETFFSKEYLPACFDEVGVWQVPNGKELYGFLARRFTTTTLPPKDIHALGLAEVERIRGEMEAIMKKTAFAGTLPEFFEHLRNDPRFFFKQPETFSPLTVR
jgi:prolyl oligopeptidase